MKVPHYIKCYNKKMNPMGPVIISTHLRDGKNVLSTTLASSISFFVDYPKKFFLNKSRFNCRYNNDRLTAFDPGQPG